MAKNTAPTAPRPIASEPAKRNARQTKPATPGKAGQPSGLPSAEQAALVQAQRLAHKALRLSNPNPRVGCVLLSPEGEVLGQGHTQAAGAAHAEVMALRDAQARGHALRGSTAVATLEPCSHHGRTGPCCEALIDAGVARVLVACQDPNPLVAGQGLLRLREAGLSVQLLAPVSASARAVRELNIGFFSRMLRQRPWVRMKMAASLDGTSALNNGQSQWITGAAARADGHAWRARACAVLTGIGTVLADDPLLDVRALKTPRQPHLVVVDSRLETPPGARLLAPLANGQARQVWIYASAANANPARIAALEARGAQVRLLPATPGTAHQKLDLAALLHDLALRGVNELHIEAGHKLNGSLLRAGCVDECLIYLAPTLLGPGQGLAALPALERLQDGLAFEFVASHRIGPDLRLRLRRRGAADF